MVDSQLHAQQYHRDRFGEMNPVAFAVIPEVAAPAPFFRPRTRTVWYTFAYYCIYICWFSFIRTKAEFDWLVKWGKAYRRVFPGLQYSWPACLNAIEADPEATHIFSKEHKNTKALCEAHQRRLAKLNKWIFSNVKKYHNLLNYQFFITTTTTAN
jgi:hypothetical protein